MPTAPKLSDAMADYTAAVLQAWLASNATQARLAQAEQRTAELMAEANSPTIWERIVRLVRKESR